MEPLKLNLSILVKARILARQEVLRARILKADVLNDDLIDGMIKQNEKLQSQMLGMLKGAIVTLFLAFVAWQGGSIKIPGTGTTIAEIPAFFEIAIVVCALQLLLVPFIFLSTQLYEGIVSVLIEGRSVDGLIDADLVKSSKMPVWLFVKYAQIHPTIGRPNLYENSFLGKLFNAILIGALTIVLLAAFLMLNISMIYLAHVGLTNSFVHSCIYAVCVLCFIVAVIGILGNTLKFNHTVRNELLLADPKHQVFPENVDQGEGDEQQ